MEKTKLSADYYSKSFQIYAKACNKFAEFEQWVEDVFPKLVLDKMTESFSVDTKINVLGVGSGSGEMDSKMATSIKSRFSSVRNVIVDPGKKQLDLYRSLVEVNDFPAGIEFDFHEAGIDEFLISEGEPPTKYHFINAVQSIYYVDDMKGTVDNLYRRLEAGGVFLITMISSEARNASMKLWDRFPPAQRYDSSDFLKQILSSLDIAFEEHHHVNNLDIAHCFDEGSEEGTYLLDYLTKTFDFRGTVSPEHYKEVKDFMVSDQCSEKKEDGAIMYTNDWDAIVIQKPL
ncbi:histamine N-methyltransferase B-like [Lytechinus variegatus]|uniref:histamine N-methyltransferase B-like n=1 Tax=Lytechinus variegatus TaxID=7654 RepID=UPI001BB2135E|nr:histamine N-methyltransferase B-like [Lytechinus variegatus]